MRFVFHLWWLLFFSSPLPALLPNRFYFGPDICYRSFSESLALPRRSQEKGFLYGWQFGYDHLVKNQVYFGGDLRRVSGQTSYEGSSQNPLSGAISPCKSSTKNSLFTIEGRAGYTLFFAPFFFTPFIGYGYQSWHRDLEGPQGYQGFYQWQSGLFGLRLFYPFMKGAIGMQVQTMRTLDAELQMRRLLPCVILLNLAPTWQFSLELPCYWRISSQWDCGLTSYFRYEPVGKSEILDHPLLRFTVEEPESQALVVGALLEIGVSF